MLFSPGNGGSGPPKILLTRNNVVPLYENQHHVHLQYFVHGRGPGARPLAGIGQGQIYPFPEKRGLRPHYVEPHPLPGDCRATYLLAAGARGGNSELFAEYETIASGLFDGQVLHFATLMKVIEE